MSDPPSPWTVARHALTTIVVGPARAGQQHVGRDHRGVLEAGRLSPSSLPPSGAPSPATGRSASAHRRSTWSSPSPPLIALPAATSPTETQSPPPPMAIRKAVRAWARHVRKDSSRSVPRKRTVRSSLSRSTSERREAGHRHPTARRRRSASRSASITSVVISPRGAYQRNVPSPPPFATPVEVGLPRHQISTPCPRRDRSWAPGPGLSRRGRSRPCRCPRRPSPRRSRCPRR